MLASTVQFSNNDQPPITPSFHSSSLGPATEENHSLRHPTACPAGNRPEIMRSTLLRAVLAASDPETRPSSQRSTHEQPVRDVRPHAGL
ncbi:hypothetical protein FBY22_7443 [Streptomyces sp. SLBN-31]|nr:hypothetical protein FBY22_7443 [Streptomyces sp. SLBN-31]